MRCSFARAFVLAGVCDVASLGCGTSCPKDGDPERAIERAIELRIPAVECAERLAKEVCTWDAAKHAERKRIADQIAASRGPSELIHVYEPLCGCVAEPIGHCFLVGSAVPYDSRGYFVVATGAPGCENAAYSGKPEVDASRCGSHAIVTPQGGSR